jgi:hypothetical protein
MEFVHTDAVAAAAKRTLCGGEQSQQITTGSGHHVLHEVLPLCLQCIYLGQPLMLRLGHGNGMGVGVLLLLHLHLILHLMLLHLHLMLHLLMQVEWRWCWVCRVRSKGLHGHGD